MRAAGHSTSANFVWTAVLVWLVSTPCRGHGQGAEFDFFEKHIRPLLVEKCYKCHSTQSEKLKGGLLLDAREGMLKGGESGIPAIVPGDAERSRLIEAVRQTNPDLQMPPKEKLNDQQIADLIAWINAGAPDPRVAETESGNRKVQAVANHWAFKPVRTPAMPAVKNRKWVQSPVDSFILAKLEAEGLRPSPLSDKRALIRRTTYDLIGLPPTEEEVEAFLRDDSADAFGSVVDRLLASPHYGERWGRYWLDVARYSDTKGYVYDREEKRFVHSHVYRDWVIRAFNEDMPYDKFLMLQIAADRLCDEEAGDRSDLAAMGFLTLGRRFLGVQHDIIDDRIDVLMRGTQGLTVGCARCHDHKFDPIPTRDYYSLYGVFSSSTEQTVPLADLSSAAKEAEQFVKGLREREEKLDKTFQKKREELTDRLRAKAADYLLAVLDVDKLPSEEFYTIMGPDDLNPVIVRQWEAYLFKSRSKFHPIFALWHDYAALPAKEFITKAAEAYEKFAAEEDPHRRVNPLVLQAFADSPPTSMREVAQRYGKLFSDVDRTWRDAVKTAQTNHTALPAALDPNQEQIRQVLYGPESPATVPNGAIVDIEWFFDENGRVELAKLQAEIDRWIINAPGAPPYSVILADRAAPKNARVFLRGNPKNKGDEVPRQFLEVLCRNGRKPFEHGSGRLDLAQAIASKDNPLTARVMVNRVWLHHFGAGLVRTPSDFGTRCEPPSHPELLDWLAARFMESGWSVKQLHRLIILSSVYQQSSVAAAPLHFSSRGREKASPRLTTAVTLDPENRLLWRMNPQRLDLEAARDSLLAASGELDASLGGKPVELLKPPLSTRRTVYGYVDRQFVPGVFRVFDFANPDMHSPQRLETTVPQQALFFMNSPFVVERARALANRGDVRSLKKPEDRIQQLYHVVFQRAASSRQVEAGLGFVKATQAEPPPEAPKPVVSAWQYGFGEYEEAMKRMKTFAPLPYFTGEAWQGGPNWPDPKLGWVQLTAEGGHAGNDLQHAAIRRWVAPQDSVVTITGTIQHEQKEGDGIRARIISSRAGLLGEWTLYNQKQEVKDLKTEAKKGDTIDFAVDIYGDLNSDMFKWAPNIRLAGPAASATGSDYASEWNAKKEFSGPPTPPPKPLNAWEKYAQVLLLSNEFMFVD